MKLVKNDQIRFVSYNPQEARILIKIAEDRYGSDSCKVLAEFYRIGVIIDEEIQKRTNNFTNKELFENINNSFENFVKSLL